MTWFVQNDEYLAESLAWLRARLQQFIQAAHTPSPNRQPVAARPTSEIEPHPALVELSRRLGLSDFERDVLLLCAAMELDTRMATFCAQAQDDGLRPYPTFALALALFDDGHWDALSPDRPLRYWRLIEITSIGAQPLTASALKIDERILNFIKGLNHLDSRLSPLLTEINQGPLELPPSQQIIVERVEHEWRQAMMFDQVPALQLLGHDSASKRLVAAEVARQFGLNLYRLAMAALPQQPSDLEAFARLWQRESLLLPIALYLDAQHIDLTPASDGPLALLARFLDHTQGVFFIDTRDALPGLIEHSTWIDVRKPTLAEQQRAWTVALPNDLQRARELAGQFDLNTAAIQRLTQIGGDQLWEACLNSTRPQLDTLAHRIDPQATWSDLVLPPDELTLLQQIADQVRQRGRVYDDWGFSHKMNRGLGITALFAGDSGTGKTMAAEVIANALRLNLYRIDLSAVVNKYIGETEKNLRRLFDAAEDGGAILFFDEADALFGKRSEVKDSHDRYANIEINYLLQRMEAYRGLAILATNLKSALDPAFMRRIRFIVNFPFPSPVERKVIWQKVFPRETPREALDYERLARLNLTGGNIHNIALNAAFSAAQNDTSVNMPIVFAAARTEFRKLDRPINEADFR